MTDIRPINARKNGRVIGGILAGPGKSVCAGGVSTRL